MPRILSFRNSFFAVAALLLLSPVAALADQATLANGQSATFNYVAVGFPNSTASATFTYNQVAGTVTLVLYSEKEPDKADTRVVDPAILQQIRRDFGLGVTP